MAGFFDRSRALAVLVLACATVSAGGNLAWAQAAWPTKRITLIVPAPPGGGLDGTARMLSQRMTEAWGQPVIVETDSGADGLIATQKVARSTPDGYTMLLQIPSLLLLKYTHKDLPFDPVGAFAPVSELARTPSVVSVSSKLPVHTVQELAAWCNKAASPCSWGSGQQLSYLYGRRLLAVSGIEDSINIPYKGTAPVITDLLGGHITIGITSIAAPLPYHQSGELRILAVNAEQRSSQAPDVPTFREAGLQLPARGSWYGLFVPRATPPEVVARIDRLVASLAKDPSANETIRRLGAEPVFGSAQDFASGIREEQQFLDEIIAQYPLN
jgi:tripartite-type tricarboxylate transporter receptor subunit TctC